MNTKVLLATLAGSVVTFLSGWVLYGMAFKDFFDANTTEAGRSIMRGEQMMMWAIFVGCLAWSLLLALIYSRWAGISSFKGGAIAGAWIMFLVALGADFFSYASMDVSAMTTALVDPVINAVQGALAGGVIGWVLGYKAGK